MLKAIDQRLNQIYAAHESARRAELAGDAAAMQGALAEGLSISCLFLRDMQRDSNLTSMKGDGKARLLLKAMAREGKLEPFLKVERALLEITKLESSAVDALIGALQRIGSAGEPAPDWQADLGTFSDTVCAAAKAEAAAKRRRPLLRRVFLAGGGAFIVLLNAFPPPQIPLPPNFAVFSTSAGFWLMDKAFGSEVDDFLDR